MLRLKEGHILNARCKQRRRIVTYRPDHDREALMTFDSLISALRDTDTMLPLLGSVLAGALIGADREFLGKQAGLRTHTLVCFASALMTLLGLRMAEWTMACLRTRRSFRRSVSLNPTPTKAARPDQAASPRFSHSSNTGSGSRSRNKSSTSQPTSRQDTAKAAFPNVDARPPRNEGDQQRPGCFARWS